MSLQPCTGLIGFPVSLGQYFFNEWPGGINPSDRKNTDSLTIPIDFSIAWAPKTNPTIGVDSTSGNFYINGLDNLANNTTLTYGSISPVTYSCQPILSLIQIQHRNLSYDQSATNEAILVFKINPTDKSQSPSSPDLIMLCRPVVLTSATPNGANFWSAVDSAALNNRRVAVNKFSLADLFTYDGSILMPMMTYETCIPTRIVLSPTASREGTTRIRVHVISQPLYIPSSNTGTGKCSLVQKFTVPVSGLADIFNQPGYTHAQFTNGKSSDGTNNLYPSISTPLSNSLSLAVASNQTVNNWNDAGGVLQTFSLLVPESFLGKSIASIMDSAKVNPTTAPKKAYKCYTIDPTKDVIGDQILIDPTTGMSLKDTMDQEKLQAAGGDPALAAALLGQAPQQGLLPGDIEQIFLIIVSLFGSIALLAYAFYIFRMWTNKDGYDFHQVRNHTIYFGFALALLASISAVISVAADSKGHPNVK